MGVAALLLQVSAFGSGAGDGDGGDLWAIEWDSKHQQWEQDTKVGPRIPSYFYPSFPLVIMPSMLYEGILECIPCCA